MNKYMEKNTLKREPMLSIKEKELQEQTTQSMI